MTKAFLEVVPVEDAWLVRMPGDSISELRESKSEAIQRAREIGRRYDAWRVHVLTKNGGVEDELSSPEASPTP